MRKISFGIVGCGRISDRHFHAINHFSDKAEIVAYCDTDPQALENAKKLAPAAKQYSSLTDLLKDSSVEVVALCTPSGLHPIQAIEAFQSGRHVVTEKPMAVRLEDGVRMVEASEKANRRLFVVKQNRLNPTIKALKQCLDAGRFGRIYMATCNVFWCRPQNYYDQAPWRGTWAMDGGAFMNQASHYVDLMTYLFGRVERVTSRIGTLARKIEAEDTGAAILEYAAGAIGTMNVTMLTHRKNFEGSITVLGERGTVRISGMAINKIDTWDFDDTYPGEVEEITKLSYEISSVYGNSHLPYYENVLHTLLNQSDALVDGREGLRSLSLLQGIYDSAKLGQTVTLKEF